MCVEQPKESKTQLVLIVVLLPRTVVLVPRTVVLVPRIVVLVPRTVVLVPRIVVVADWVNEVLVLIVIVLVNGLVDVELVTKVAEPVLVVVDVV